MLFVRVQNVLCWRKFWNVLIINVVQFTEKILQIPGFGEPRQLTVVVKPDINHTFDTRGHQESKKSLGGLWVNPIVEIFNTSLR